MKRTVDVVICEAGIPEEIVVVNVLSLASSYLRASSTPTMSFLNLDNDNTKRAAIIAASVVIGGAVTYFLWDKYSTEDASDWAARKQQGASQLKANAAQKLKNAKEAVVEKAAEVKEKAVDVKEKAAQKLHGKTTETVKETEKVVVAVAPAATVVATGQTVLVTETEPMLKKVKERAPVVQEVVHPVEVEEIQPVIHREIRKTEVHQVTQPIYEEVTAPLKEINRELIAEHKPTLYADASEYSKEFEAGLESNTQRYAETKKTVVYKPAIIEEVIKTDIIEVIQPVIHRDTVEPTVIHTSQPIYEKVKEQPVVVHETRSPLILTHEEVARLQTASEAEQLTILEKYSEKQLAHGLVDPTPVVAPTEEVVITETVIVEQTVVPANTIAQ
ncbi:hypothetical protein PROFUN_14968 [Planoprotostelium fungivorum]|uniref:Uncharacterized protein n=1 Tax=Planoprotostelium fungivorum TaxID=1890364 RepID=A0A2P6MY62_9EUKA|nr:hypothetical protein PROFUN_14968 [Planoprotostelium fungivorum]